MACPPEVTISAVDADGEYPGLAGRAFAPVAAGRSAAPATAGSVLQAAATCWLVVTGLGQSMFVAYLLGFYGRTAIQGRFDAWNQVFPRSHVAGDTLHDTVVAMHLAFAALITVGGLLQLMTGVRRWFPRFHRWNGRVYLVSAFVMGLGGLAMVWTGTHVGDLPQQVAISINAVLIMLCAVMVLRHALARRFALHRRWALRLFLVVSGVWFFRIGLTFWIMLNGGPLGFDPDTFTGPALTTIAFAQYLLPLAMLQLYFYAQDRAGPRGRVLMACGLFASTLVTAAGIVAASMMLWLPHLH
ncbi:MAG: DUF2306 domain-containing protein [Pseudomonadota bacterium]|nr:DUF2306 domain-containing protein [Pseudomonadota bacterium]